MTLKKSIVTLAAVMISAAIFTACSGDTASEAATPKTVEGIYTAVSAANPIANPRDLEDMNIELDFMLPLDDIAAYQGQASNDGGDAGMVIVIEATEGNAQAVYDALETYAGDQVMFWSNYEEFSDAKASVEDSVLMMDGNFVVQAFASNGADYTAIETAMTEALG